MSRIIEAKAVISAEDRTGRVFDAIGKKFKDIGKGAKASADVGKLAREIDKAAAGLKQIESFRGVQASFAQARTNFRTAQDQVTKLASALENARKAAAAFDGVKSFSKTSAIGQEMAAARRQVSEVERQFTNAQRAVKTTAAAFESQAAALKGVKAEMSGSGLSVGKLTGEQNRLKTAIDGANAAMVRQGQLSQANARMSDGMAAAGRRQAEELRRKAESQAQSRRIAEGMGAAGRPAVGPLASPTGTMAGGAAIDPGRGDPRQGQGGFVDAAAGLGVGVVLGGAYGRARDGWLEMDEATRRQRAILGIDTLQQQSLNAQALKIGQDTRFSNPDVVKAQTRIGSALPDHLKDPKVIAAITENSKNYALAMGTTMDQASEALLGRMLGLRMDMSNPEAASASAKESANKLVQFAKSSGADHNDVMGYTKFGAAPGNVGGFSPEFSDALAAQLRRIGYEGSMAGNFVRASATKLAVPTSKGLGALAAAGITHSDYVKPGGELSAANLNSALKLKFGKSLSADQQARIHALMQDETVVGNREEFVPQVSAIVQETLARRTKKGAIHAQDGERIAKSVNEYLSASSGAVDIQRLMRDVIAKGLTPALAKYLFGQEHGGRAQALDLKTLDKDTAAFKNTPGDRAEKVGNEINAGAYGAYQRMIGSIETFYMRLGQVTDGPLTRFYDTAGNVVDKISNLPDGVLKMGVAAAGTTGALLAFKGAMASFNIAKGLLVGDTALKGSAAALDGSAAALTRAATLMGAKGAGPGGVVATPGADGKPAKGGKLAAGAKIAGGVAAGVGLGPLAEAANEMGILAPPSTENGLLEGGVRFLDPGLADRIYGDRVKAFPSMTMTQPEVVVGNDGTQTPAYPSPASPRPDGLAGVGHTGSLAFGLDGPQSPEAIARQARNRTARDVLDALPKAIREAGPGGLDPATGALHDGNPAAGMAPDRPWLKDWYQSKMPTWLGGAKPSAWVDPPSKSGPGGAPPVVAAHDPSGQAKSLGDGKTIPVEVVSLPDRGSLDDGKTADRIDPSGQLRAQGNTLERTAEASATAANGGKPIEATVRPDQITAQVKDMPPVTGEATVTVDNHHQIAVTLNTDMLDAKVNAAANKAVAKIPLNSGGGRPGAVSMPGAASAPGAS